MFRHFFAFIITLFVTFSSNSQSLNKYKYVVVPDGYSFLKGKKDRYQLNSLTQFLFKKYGFTAIRSDEPYPEDLQKGGCNALYADVNNISSLFKIKLEVILRDCNNITVFTSLPGKSHRKEFKQGYQEALRGAFMDVKKLNYFYKKTALVSVDNKEVSDVPSDIEQGSDLSAKPIAAAPNAQKSIINDEIIGDRNVVYLFNGVVYDFKKVEEGYLLHKVNKDGATTASIGRILNTNKENRYIVQAADLSGSGAFDSFGNFVLERVNPATGKTIRDTFAREDR